MLRIKNIVKGLKHTWNLLITPKSEWPVVFSDTSGSNRLFAHFWIPFSVCISLLVLFIDMVQYPFWTAVRSAITYFVSVSVGVYIVWLFMKEYLTHKVVGPERTATKLIIYCSAIFLFFNSLSSAIEHNFISQLMSLFSIVFLRTLYAGIQYIPELESNKKTNLFIISALTIICVPVIIKRFLMIILNIPVFNI